MYDFKNEFLLLNNTQYFYKAIMKFKGNIIYKTSEYSEFKEHSDLPRIPYLNPFYKKFKTNKNKEIVWNLNFNLKHSEKINFEILSKFLYSPKDYLYRYERYKNGHYDEIDELEGLTTCGYKRTSDFIPDLKQSLILEPSIYFKGDEIIIYLSQVCNVFYKSSLHMDVKDDYFEFLNVHSGNLYEGLFDSENSKKLICFIPFIKGPNRISGGDGSGSFYNIFYPKSMKFIFNKKGKE